ncbi:MAG TPA: zf-HC2 domain-containing protein [bacterium]|nr:zf-HC2 domain-containing protein [bacterium]
MKCDKEKLVSLADRCLSEHEARAVEEHVAGCANCRQELELLKSDAAMLRQEPKPEVPAYLATRIIAGVRQRQVQAGPWLIATPVGQRGLSRIWARAAAVVLVALGVWLGTALARATVGPQQSFADRLAQVGLELPNGEDK